MRNLLKRVLPQHVRPSKLRLEKTCQAPARSIFELSCCIEKQNKGNNILAESRDSDDDGAEDDGDCIVAILISAFGDESADETAQRVFSVSCLVGTDQEWEN